MALIGIERIAAETARRILVDVPDVELGHARVVFVPNDPLAGFAARTFAHEHRQYAPGAGLGVGTTENDQMRSATDWRVRSQLST